MVSGLSRYKPGIKRRTHLLLTAFLWTIIGLLLLIKGWFQSSTLVQYQGIVVALAATAGFVKSLSILDKAATRAIQRILNFKDGTCLGAVYSLKTWGLVLCMAGMGVILRNSSLPVMLLSFVYIAVGWSLLFSSRLAWVAWIRSSSPE